MDAEPSNSEIDGNPSPESLGDEQLLASNRESNGIAIGMLLFAGVGILASSRHGYLGGFQHPIQYGIVFSLIAGAAAGLLMFPKYRIAALTCVPIASVSGYLALDWYLPGRESVNTVEIVLIQCASALPAIIAGNLIRIFVYNDKRSEPQSNAG